MFGWLGAYLERRRRRKARAAKMASDSAQMAAMLQANAPQRGRRRKGFWAKLFGTGQRTSMPLPPPPAPPRPLPVPADLRPLQPATPAPMAPPIAAAPIAAAPIAAAMPVAMPLPAMRTSFPLPPPLTPAAPEEEAMPPGMYGPPPPPRTAPAARPTPSAQATSPAREIPTQPEAAPTAHADQAAPVAAPAAAPAYAAPATVVAAVPPVMSPVMSPVMVAAPRARFGWIAASIGWTLRFAIIVLLIAAVLGAAAWPVWRESERLEVEILPIAMPADLAANGLTPEVAASRLIDAIDGLLTKTRENERNRPSKTDLGRIPAYAVTPDRLTLRSLASLLRDLLGRPSLRITGDVTRQGTELQLRLRAPGGRSFATTTVPAEAGADKLFQQVAVDVWQSLNPVIFAWYIADSGDAEDIIRPRLVSLAQEQRLPPEMSLQISVLYARSLMRSGRAEEALATLEALERRATNLPLLWNVKAQALIDLGRVDAGLEAQKQAVVQEGTTVWSHVSSAHLMMKLGRPREALTDLQSARRLAPGNFDAVMLEGVVMLNLGRPAEALALISRVNDVRPNLPGLQEALGNALFANGRVDEAMRAYETEVARNPTSISARLARANAMRAQRKPEEALAAVDEILRIAPRDGIVISLRGWTLMDLSRYDQALALFDGLLKDRPDDASALHARGTALAALGRRAEAIGAISRAAELQPGNRRFATDLARLRGVAPPGQAAPPGSSAPAAAPAGAQRPSPAAPAPAPAPAPARQ